MTEEIKKPEKKEEEATPSSLDKLAELKEVLKKTEDAALRIEQANEKTAELQSFTLMGGKTDTGDQPDQKKEETPREYSARIMTGDLS